MRYMSYTSGSSMTIMVENRYGEFSFGNYYYNCIYPPYFINSSGYSCCITEKNRKVLVELYWIYQLEKVKI